MYKHILMVCASVTTQHCTASTALLCDHCLVSAAQLCIIDSVMDTRGIFRHYCHQPTCHQTSTIFISHNSQKEVDYCIIIYLAKGIDFSHNEMPSYLPPSNITSDTDNIFRVDKQKVNMLWCSATGACLNAIMLSGCVMLSSPSYH